MIKGLHLNDVIALGRKNEMNTQKYIFFEKTHYLVGFLKNDDDVKYP